MIDFEWYRTFVCIYQEGTVSAAAQRRLMTQPAMSQHLAALESALETPLFQRTPRKMVPTAEGQALYAKVIGSVEQLERLSHPLQHQHQEILRLRIGAPREYFYVLGLPALQHHREYQFQLGVTFGQTMRLIRLLENDQLDAVIATQQIKRQQIQYFPLSEERFVLVSGVHTALPEGLKPDQLVKWLEEQNWITYANDLPIIRRYWQEVFRRRPILETSLILPDLLAVARAVELNVGLSVLPHYLCDQALRERRLHVLWEPEVSPQNHLYLAVSRDQVDQPGTVWLQQQLQVYK